MEPLFVVQPAGVTPASTWTPPAFEKPRTPPAVLVPKLNGATGERASLFQNDDAIYQAIATEFRTVFGSGAAVQNIGHKLLDIRKNDDTAAESARFEVDRILSPYIAQGLIRVDEITIVAGPSAGFRGSVTVRFTLLKNGLERTVTA
jgi:hypothetical protein